MTRYKIIKENTKGPEENSELENAYLLGSSQVNRFVFPSEILKSKGH